MPLESRHYILVVAPDGVGMTERARSLQLKCYWILMTF